MPENRYRLQWMKEREKYLFISALAWKSSQWTGDRLERGVGRSFEQRSHAVPSFVQYFDAVRIIHVSRRPVERDPSEWNMSRQLLVIMECRCSEDYASFVSQAVIEAYLKMFMIKLKQMTDSNDLDFTDYEVHLSSWMSPWKIDDRISSCRKRHLSKYFVYSSTITNNVFTVMRRGSYRRKKIYQISRVSSSELKMRDIITAVVDRSDCTVRWSWFFGSRRMSVSF